MPSLRAVPAVVAIAFLTMPLAACNEGEANAALASILRALENQRQDEFHNDPFNWEYQRDQNFRSRWPPDVPLPQGGTPDWHNNPTRNNDGLGMGSEWSDRSSADADEYGERLEEAGFEQTDRTTETDPATGWERTETTYRNDRGTEVVVWYDSNGDFRVLTD